MPRRLHQEAPEERLRRVGQLEELERGQDPEHVAEDRERADRYDRRADAGRRRCAPQLDDPGQVALPEQTERRHDQRVDEGDRDAGLDERVEPVAAPDRDDPGGAAEEHVGGHLERVAVDRAGDDRDDRRQQHRGAGVEEQRDEDPDRGGRDDERQPGSTGGQLEGEGREHEEQPDEGEGIRAVPELGPEAPDPGEQQPDQEHREQRPAARAE